MENEHNRRSLLHHGIVAWLATVLIVIMWEFALEEPILNAFGYDTGPESLALHIHFIVEASVCSAIGITLAGLLYRGLNKPLDDEESGTE